MTSVLITGCNRGIGLEFVSQCVARGDRVFATCRTIDKADRLRELCKQHPGLTLLELDVADQKSLEAFPAKLQGEAIDIFINNAGVYGPASSRFGTINAAAWLPVLQVNTVAPLLLTQLLMDNLRRGHQKKLVYITSMMGSIADNGSGGSYIYRSSKTALNQVVKGLSVDLAKDGFTAVVLHPGWVLTDMGGPNAQIDTRTSVSGMLSVIDELNQKSNGGFYNYDGSRIHW